MQMPFGKHRGAEIEDIPDGYLRWVVENCTRLDEELRGEIIAELDERGVWYDPDAAERKRQAEEGGNGGAFRGRRSGGSGQSARQEQHSEPRQQAHTRIPEVIEHTLDKWFRLLAMAYHPDRGGDVDTMQRINANHEAVKKALRK